MDSSASFLPKPSTRALCTQFSCPRDYMTYFVTSANKMEPHSSISFMLLLCLPKKMDQRKDAPPLCPPLICPCVKSIWAAISNPWSHLKLTQTLHSAYCTKLVSSLHVNSPSAGKFGSQSEEDPVDWHSCFIIFSSCLQAQIILIDM